MYDISDGQPGGEGDQQPADTLNQHDLMTGGKDAVGRQQTSETDPALLEGRRYHRGEGSLEPIGRDEFQGIAAIGRATQHGGVTRDEPTSNATAAGLDRLHDADAHPMTAAMTEAANPERPGKPRRDDRLPDARVRPRDDESPGGSHGSRLSRWKTWPETCRIVERW